MKNRNHGEASSVSSPLRVRPEFLRVGLVVLVFGLLLWARFLLVTGHPRTAMADPAATGQKAAIGAPNEHANATDPLR